MPDTVTHYITARRFIDAHPEVSEAFTRGFYYGSQGPDLFFFGGSKRSYVFASALHEGDPRLLFSGIGEDIKGKNELYQGYALGVLLHYYGDRAVHPYVGWRCRLCPAPYTHVFTETKIDMAAYSREFNTSISNFDYDAAFRRSSALARAIRGFWGERLSAPLGMGYIKRCLWLMGVLTKLFTKAQPAIIRIARLIGRIFNNSDFMLCHFKTAADDGVMNDAHAPWDAPDGERNESVGELLDEACAAFELAYDEIKRGVFRFEHTESFSYGS